MCWTIRCPSDLAGCPGASSAIVPVMDTAPGASTGASERPADSTPRTRRTRSRESPTNRSRRAAVHSPPRGNEMGTTKDWPGSKPRSTRTTFSILCRRSADTTPSEVEAATWTARRTPNARLRPRLRDVAWPASLSARVTSPRRNSQTPTIPSARPPKTVRAAAATTSDGLMLSPATEPRERDVSIHHNVPAASATATSPPGSVQRTDLASTRRDKRAGVAPSAYRIAISGARRMLSAKTRPSPLTPATSMANRAAPHSIGRRYAILRVRHVPQLVALIPLPRFVAGNASARCLPTVATSSCAASGDTPGRSLPTTVRNGELRRRSLSRGCRPASARSASGVMTHSLPSPASNSSLRSRRRLTASSGTTPTRM